jgi:Ser/Thr protein kinase RdoA (MazF antagonist)
MPPRPAAWTPAWPALVAAPEEFLALGVCTREWFDDVAEALTTAEATLDTTGDALVHGDVRSDNVCFVGDRVVLVDWSEARRGSARFDVWNLAQTLPLETDVEPFDVAPDGAAFAATSAARNAERIYAQPESLPPWLMGVLRRIGAIDLDWAARCLDLPPRVG